MHWDQITWLFSVVYMVALIKLVLTSIKIVPVITRQLYWISLSLDVLYKLRRFLAVIFFSLMLTGGFAHIFWGQEAEHFSDLEKAIYLSVELLVNNLSFFGAIPPEWFLSCLG